MAPNNFQLKILKREENDIQRRFENFGEKLPHYYMLHIHPHTIMLTHVEQQ